MGSYLDQQEIDLLLKGIHKQPQKNNGENEKAPSSGGNKPFSERPKEKGPLVERVDFAPFKPGRTIASPKPEQEFFDNISLVVSGELGNVEITVRDLLKLDEGSVIRLDKTAGESAMLLLNGQFLGQAEVVVINDCFGLRITSIGNGDTGIPEEE